VGNQPELAHFEGSDKAEGGIIHTIVVAEEFVAEWRQHEYSILPD
jgi:hypothetical protein